MFLPIFYSGSSSTGSQVYYLIQKKINIVKKANSICWISELNWLTGQLKEGSKGNRWDSTGRSNKWEKNELGRESEREKMEWGLPYVV